MNKANGIQCQERMMSILCWTHKLMSSSPCVYRHNSYFIHGSKVPVDLLLVIWTLIISCQQRMQMDQTTATFKRLYRRKVKPLSKSWSCCGRHSVLQALIWAENSLYVDSETISKKWIKRICVLMVLERFIRVGFFIQIKLSTFPVSGRQTAQTKYHSVILDWHHHTLICALLC